MAKINWKDALRNKLDDYENSDLVNLDSDTPPFEIAIDDDISEEMIEEAKKIIAEQNKTIH